MSQATAKRFLHAVWSKQPGYPDDYAFVSAKDWDTGDWADHPSADPANIELPTLKDLYFAPCQFKVGRRLKKYALPSRWLYADLDEVDPRKITPLPTFAWETSPGRYQCLWLLDAPLRRNAFEDLNQRMTYFVGADKGGWSSTKVLRVPGSISTKHEQPFRVRSVVLPDRQLIHTVPDLQALLRDVETAQTAASTAPLPPAHDLPDRDEVYATHRRRIGVRARQLINTRTVVSGDDRSARMWELENLLLDKRLSCEEVLVLVRPTVWNKYTGQRRELRILWQEINKAKANRARKQPKQPAKKKRAAETKPVVNQHGKVKRVKIDKLKPGVEFITFRDFMTRPLARATWLVEGIWSEGAHGMMAGEPKTFKTLLELDLAVSIASGTPFLGRFAVPATGPVCIIQEENSPGDMQDRLMRIASSRGVGPALARNAHTHDAVIDFGQDLGIHLLNNQGFNLGDDDWLRWLESRIRKIRPALVCFDPLYLVTPGIDENSAVDMTPILAKLLRLKQKYGCGIQIVHHYHKPKNDQKGRSATRMSGTGVFHRWLASAIYVERPSEDDNVIKISGEHRSHGQGGAYRVEFELGDDDDLHYSARVDQWVEPTKITEHDTTEEIMDVVTENAASNEPFTSIADIAAELGISENAARKRARKANLSITLARIDGRQRSVVINPQKETK